jgi:hypothetical protein
MLNQRERPTLERKYVKLTIMATEIYDAISKGQTASEYRKESLNNPQRVIRMPKALFQADLGEIYEIFYSEDGFELSASSQNIFPQTKVIRFFYMYDSEALRLHKDFLIRDGILNNLATTSNSTFYKLSHTPVEGLAANNLTEIFVAFLREGANFKEDFPEEIANIFEQSKYLKPSDLPYMTFVSRLANYKAVGPEEKDSFLFLDKGCGIDIERKHKGSIFARQYALILQSEQSLGKNIIAHNESRIVFINIGDNVIIGQNSTVKRPSLQIDKIYDETYIFNNVETFGSVGPYQNIKSTYPSILSSARDISDFFINIDIQQRN